MGKLGNTVSPWLLCAAVALALGGCGGGAGEATPLQNGGGGGVPTSAPVITTQPAAQTVAAGGSATFSVVASNGPLVYQWLSASSPVGLFTEIRGATNATYTVTNAGAAENGRYYRVLVSNVVGNAVSDPVQLTVTGLGGAPAPSDSCGPWLLASGTEVRTAFTTVVPPGAGESVMTVTRPASFDGRALTEVRTVQPLLSPTVTLDARVYGEPDAATGHVTLYGAHSVVTSVSGGSTTVSTTQSIATTPSVDTEFGLAAGATAPARSVTFTDTTVVSVDGVDGAPATSTRTDSVAATTFVGYETVTVPAGTFATCRYSSGGASRWLLKGYGSVVKDSAGGQATSIKVNGSVITGN